MQRPLNATITFCLDNVVKSVWGESTVGLLPTGEPYSLAFLNKLMSKEGKVYSEGYCVLPFSSYAILLSVT